MRGRIPKPTNLKLLHGNPGRRPLNLNEPKPESKAPPCPKDLNVEAKREWRRLSKYLEQLGVLTTVDRAAFAAYCQSYGRWIEAERKVRELGTVVKSPNGYPMISPYLTIANTAQKQMVSILTEFGLTPASRTRIHAMPPEREDPAAKKAREFFDGE